jgi:hypothetical protein
MTRDAERPTSRVGTRRPPPTAPERLLVALGADPDFVDGVFGDMAEEHARRAAHEGARAAAHWRTRELLRSMPHLVGSALRHGGARAYLRLAAISAMLVLSLSLATLAILRRDGPPARLDAGLGYTSEGVVVNSMRPVQLPVRVLDKAGNQLTADSVRFTWLSGAPLDVSPSGIVTCRERADAIVGATLGGIATQLHVRCRPVQVLRADSWMNFIAGDTTRRHLPFVALGLDNRPVMQLRGAVRVMDDRVAGLDGASVRPRASGQTLVIVEVGEQQAKIAVVVHALVPSFDGLRDDQREVARPVRLARGDTVHWPLPGGSYWLKYQPRRTGDAPPSITVEGEIGCWPGGDGRRTHRLPLGEYGTYCMVQRGGTASVMLAHGIGGAEWVEGTLAIERVELR